MKKVQVELINCRRKIRLLNHPREKDIRIQYLILSKMVGMLRMIGRFKICERWLSILQHQNETMKRTITTKKTKKSSMVESLAMVRWVQEIDNHSVLTTGSKKVDMRVRTVTQDSNRFKKLSIR